MQVTELSAEGLKHQFKIVVPAGDLTSKIDERLAEMAKTAALPGFRPGKVPVSLLKKQYGQALFGEAVEAAVNTSTAKAIEDRGLKPALQPRVDLKQLEEGKDVEFEVVVEVLPEIGALDFSGIELERLKAEVPEKDIDEALDRIAKANREQKPVDPPRPAQKGDAIKLDFVGSVDGVEFPGGAANDYTLELGSGSFIPGFEDQLLGAEVGKTVDVKVTFPAEYGAAELAGKDAVFKCTIKEIHEFVDKPADDELAKKSNFENLEAMRKAIGERIGQDYTQISRTMIKRQLLDKLADSHKFAVPEGLVEGEFNAIWQRIEEAKKNGQKVEDDEEKMRKEYRDIAERRVRLGLLLADVGRSNSIDVTPEELNQAAMREAMRYQGQERQVLEYFSKNPEAKDQLRAPIFEEKTVDFILELAKVSEKSVTPEELLKAAREAEEEEVGEKAAD
ncbi:MAG: trigger factor [Reyranella sp.]|uniref:trigger factor n=1 Tax=Reyranella sp. TaxID=1929291 RepID=UPI001221D6CB|nr:trigger factor [Reyranella sp.]TAJ86859.1 MAG: trigger factor [Reyranella sp.]TBR28416.1 MAG: trigger factor [Reyranella sp.]